MIETRPPGPPDAELLHHEGLVSPPRRARARPSVRSGRGVWTAVLVVAVALSLVRAGVGQRDLVNPGGWSLVGRFFAAALRPELSPEFLRITWDATLTTVSYAVLGTAVSVLVGVVGGVLGSETWWRVRPGGGVRARRLLGRLGWLASRVTLGLPRGIHEAVWGLFLIIVLGLDPLVGVLAIGLPYGAVTAKVFSELLDETPREAFAAVRASGVGRLKSLGYTLLPQAFPDMLSYGFYRFECSVRASAILGIIGAGGLGFQLSLSFQSLRYTEMWTLLAALVAVSGLTDLWSTTLRRRGGGSSTAASGGTESRLRRDRVLTGSVAGAAVLVAVAAWHLGIDASTLWSARARGLLADLAADAFPPGLGAGGLGELARLSLQTLEMSILATAVASVGGMVVAFAAAATVPVDAGALRRVVPWAARAGLLFCRAVPSPVWALLLLFVLFPGPLPGALALGLYNFGVLGRLMAEVVENLDPWPVRVLRAGGASGPQSFLYGVLPRTLPRFVAYSLYRWEVTIRETVVVGLVGAGGLGRLLSEQLAAFAYHEVVWTLLALITLTFLVDLASSLVRRALR
ncbi:MAG: PhnE/PtxC family ABC transporter permease [Acidimicrobiales bacterium]